MSEPQRLALHAAARRALGEEEGDTLMALSPPANTDMATMQALERTEERLGARIDAVEAKLGARIDQVEAKLAARIEAAVAASNAALTKSIHASELRSTTLIILVFLGANYLG